MKLAVAPLPPLVTLVLPPRIATSSRRTSRAIAAPRIATSPAIATRASANVASIDTSGLYPYQTVGARYLAERRSALLCDEMGLGKSVQALRALPPRASALVVCPASLRINWANEVAKWRPDLKSEIDSVLRPVRPGVVLVISYDALPEYDGHTRHLVPWSLADVIVIFDEAHYAKNHKAERTRSARALSRQARTVWALTGTPLLNRPFELYSVLQLARTHKAAFPTWNEFLSAFGGKRGRYGTTFAGPRADTPSLVERAMLRRTRAAVMPDLPRKQYATLTVEVSDSLLPTLDVVESQWLGCETDELPPFELLSAARAAMARERIPMAHEYVERWESETDKPLVAFSAHVDPVVSLGERGGWTCVHGALNTSERAERIAAFQAGQYRGIALTIKVGGLGINLSRADAALFIDRSYTPAENWQAEDRLPRIGSVASSVLITRMVADHPLDRRLNEILDAKQSLITGALG